MAKIGIWATMQARKGREADAHAFLEESCRRISAEEPGTTAFYVVDFGDGQFGLFNAQADEAAFNAHVNGEIAAWTMEMNEELFTEPYAVQKGNVIAFKP